MGQSLEYEQRVAATAADVYRAFTNAAALRKWFCDAAMAEAKPGGRFYVGWNDGYYSSGEFTRLEPHRAVAFTWHGRGEPDPSQVEIVLHETDGATVVGVSHSGVGEDGPWREIVQGLQTGWQYSLENLQSVLETGQDLRFVRRPMLGIYVGEFEQKTAAELGVPVESGIWIDGVVAGMGAEAAGLQKNDVVVSMAGQPVTDWPSLTAVLQAARAGDNVEVIYYRGGEKRTATMTLSGRPIPDVPEMAEALAQAVAALYEESDGALAQILEGVSEAEATYRPDAEQWNVKETLAHLIISERDNHNQIADLIEDCEPWSDHFANTAVIPARLQSLVAAYPTTADLLQELLRSETVTISMLRKLPAAVLSRKDSYWPLGYRLLDTESHVQDHLEQIQQTVAAARRAIMPAAEAESASFS